MADKLGMPLMPWQRMVADVGFEIDPETELMAYRELIVTVPRQNGKTLLMLAVESERCIVWPEKQRVVYTAQTGTDARDKLLEDQVPVLEAKLARYIGRVYRAKGEEAVRFKNGSRIQLSASSQASGHGATVDLGVLDEIWADEDNRREQSIVPMMNTRPNAQILICSTQGTDKSVYLNRKTEIGRAAAAEDKGSGIAYFEWSIPKGVDHRDPAVWWENMPALGWTITESVIAHALATMEESEWLRAYGNQSTRSERDQVIPAGLWSAVQDATAEVDRTSVTFGVDVLPDRSMSAVVASDGDAIEVLEHRPGTGWIVDYMKKRIELWGGTITVDGGGPAVSLADEMEYEGLIVTRLTNAEVVAACARFYDAVADVRMRVFPSELLDTAVSGLAKRPMGDRFMWSRSTSGADITPLMAATLAYGTDGGGFTLYVPRPAEEPAEEEKEEEAT